MNAAAWPASSPRRGRASHASGPPPGRARVAVSFACASRGGIRTDFVHVAAEVLRRDEAAIGDLLHTRDDGSHFLVREIVRNAFTGRPPARVR